MDGCNSYLSSEFQTQAHQLPLTSLQLSLHPENSEPPPSLSFPWLPAWPGAPPLHVWLLLAPSSSTSHPRGPPLPECCCFSSGASLPAWIPVVTAQHLGTAASAVLTTSLPTAATATRWPLPTGHSPASSAQWRRPSVTRYVVGNKLALHLELCRLVHAAQPLLQRFSLCLERPSHCLSLGNGASLIFQASVSLPLPF